MAPDPPTSARVELGVESTDREIVEAAIARDERAWRLLVDRYSRLVYSIPRRRGLAPEACEDIFQNVFAIIAKELRGLRDIGSLPKWIITTATRETWRVGRKIKADSGATVTIESSDPPAAPAADEVARLERQHEVHRALTALGGRCEQLLRAIFLDRSKPSYESIADRLGIPMGSIGPTRARCLAKLAELVRDPG